MCQGKANVSPMVYWHWNKFVNHGEKKFYTPNWGETLKGWILHESCLLMWHLQVKVQGTRKYWKVERVKNFEREIQLQTLWKHEGMCKHQKSFGYLGLCCCQWGDNLSDHSKSIYSAHKLSHKTSTTPGLWVWVRMILQRTMEGYAGSYLGRCQELLCTDSSCKIRKTILQIHMKTIT
jgi:hypothetical protein